MYRVFEEAYSFITRNTSSTSQFVKGSPKRLDASVYPEEAVREALINALAHLDYSSAEDVSASPDGVTEQSLLKGRISILRNPNIAHVLYLRRLMEKAGRGSVLMVQTCREHGLSLPMWKSDPKLGVTVIFSTPEVIKLLRHLTGEMSRWELQDVMGLRDAEHFRKASIHPALNYEVIEMTVPEKPTSSKQKYRMSVVGERVLEHADDSDEMQK